MQETETVNVSRELDEEKKLMQRQELGIRPTQLAKQRNRTTDVGPVAPILVSEQQFVTVREEHLASLNLLNESGKTLLRALDKMIPSEESVRGFGEYSAQGARQLAKSVCDIVLTKNTVVRQMYSIARDEI